MGSDSDEDGADDHGEPDLEALARYVAKGPGSKAQGLPSEPARQNPNKTKMTLGSDTDEDGAEEHGELDLEALARYVARGPVSQASTRVKIHPLDTSAPRWVYSDPDKWVAPTDPGELLHCLA